MAHSDLTCTVSPPYVLQTDREKSANWTRKSSETVQLGISGASLWRRPFRICLKENCPPHTSNELSEAESRVTFNGRSARTVGDVSQLFAAQSRYREARRVKDFLKLDQNWTKWNGLNDVVNLCWLYLLYTFFVFFVEFVKSLVFDDCDVAKQLAFFDCLFDYLVAFQLCHEEAISLSWRLKCFMEFVELLGRPKQKTKWKWESTWINHKPTALNRTRLHPTLLPWGLWMLKRFHSTR